MIGWKQRIGVLSGCALEFYDMAVYAAISAYIAHQFFPENFSNSILFVWIIFALRFLVRPLGGFLVGLYADKVGRKSAIITSSFFMGVATLSMAVMPTYENIGIIAPVLLLVFQLIQAFFLGGELPSVISYLLETSSKNERARISSMVAGSAILGILISTLVVLCIESLLTKNQMEDFGWRIPLLFGFGNIIFSFYFKLKLTEFVPSPQKNDRMKLNIIPIAKVFLVTVPGAVILYSQAFTSKIMVSQYFPPHHWMLNTYPVVVNILMLILLLSSGFLVDKLSTTGQAFKVGTYIMLFLSLPFYMLMDSGNLIFLFIGQLGLIVIASLILSTLDATIFDQTSDQNRASTIGIGYNVALSIFGGFTPLIITFLSQKDFSYIGIYVSLAGVIPFFTFLEKKHFRRIGAPI